MFRYPGLQLRDAERPTRRIRLGARAAVAAGRGISDRTVPALSAVRSCAAAIEPSWRYFATACTVSDIEALRAALAVTRLTLDGVSYGSYVAEQLALAHSAQVSRLVLDSVVRSWNVDPFQLADMRQTAAVLRAACAARGCAFDPADDLANVVRRHHDGCGLLDTMVEMSVGDPSFSAAAAALHAAAAGHPATLIALIARVHAADAARAAELSHGLHASALCPDMRMPWAVRTRRATPSRAAVGNLAQTELREFLDGSPSNA